MAPGLAEGMTITSHLGAQLTGVVAVCVWSGIASAILLFVIKLLMSLRDSQEDEESGLDTATHGESAYGHH
jgi:Amt family ammonium transporter